jgi:hypothetical protein
MEATYPSARLAAAERFQTNARFYVSEEVRLPLCDIATAPALAVLVHLEAFERSAFARIDRVMRCALAALGRVDVQVVLVSHDEGERGALLHRELTTAWWLDLRQGWRDRGGGGRRASIGLAGAAACVRARMAGVQLIGISDERALLDALTEHDRGIAIGNASVDVSVRAALWWLVDTRARLGTIDR